MKTLLTLLFSVLAVCANAGTHVWSGAGANTYWNNAANWSSGGAPVAGEAAPVKLIFPANAVSRTSTVNISNLKIDFIEVDIATGNYSFPTAGISISLTGAAGDNFKAIGTWGNLLWQPGINLQATCRMNVPGSSVNLELQGVVSGNGGIVKTGPGILGFTTGGVANTFTGTMRLEEGQLVLNKISGTPCFGGKLELVGGTCYIRQSHQIPDTSAVELNGGDISTNPIVGLSFLTDTLGNVTFGSDSRVDVATNTTIVFGGSMTFVNSASTRPYFSSAGTGAISLGAGTRTIQIPHPDSTLDIYAVIIDGATSTSLVKSGAGQLRLFNDNSFSGTVEVKEGKLSQATANGLGTTAKGTTIRQGATLKLTSAMTFPAGESLALEGALEIQGSVDMPGPVVFSGAPTLRSGLGHLLKMTGALSGNASELKILDGGQVEWSGGQGNTYIGILKLMPGSELVAKKSAGQAIAGPVDLGGGMLTLGASHQIADTVPLWFSQGGTLNVNGKTESVLCAYGDTEALITLGDGALTFLGNGSTQLGSPSHAAKILGSPLSSIRKKGAGTWSIYREDYSFAGDESNALHVDAGKVALQGIWPGSIFLNGGALEGNAVTGSITNNGGTLNLTTLQPKGVTTPGNGGSLVCAINSEVPGTGFGRLKVTGGVNLTGLTLNLSLNYQPLNNETFTIIENDGTDAVTGTFNGLPEGAIIYAGGQPFKISYKGGSNANDVVLLFQGIGAPGPEITSLRLQADHNVRIDIAWLPGKKVVVERAFYGDLSKWSTETSNITLDSEGKATVLIQVFSSPKEFFRLRTVP